MILHGMDLASQEPTCIAPSRSSRLKCIPSSIFKRQKKIEPVQKLQCMPPLSFRCHVVRPQGLPFRPEPAKGAPMCGWPIGVGRLPVFSHMYICILDVMFLLQTIEVMQRRIAQKPLVLWSFWGVERRHIFTQMSICIYIYKY